MNTILKNFLFVLKRFKTASFLNIAGLAIAFVSFFIIMMQVQYEWTFDKCHSNADRIFRVDMPRYQGDKYASFLTRGFADDVLASSPHIVSGSVGCPFSGKTYFTTEEGSSQKGFDEFVATCYPSLTGIFDFVMVEGDKNCLEDPEKVIIPQSMAKRMFGDESAVGKMMHPQAPIWFKSDATTFTIGGVYKDFPENTQINNIAYTRVDNTTVNNWDGMNFVAYILLDRPESKTAVEDNYNSITDFVSHHLGEETRLRLTPLTDIYYMPNQLPMNAKTGNPNTTNLLFLIAILVMVIACINFINFNTALAPLRMKGINTRKVLGNSVSDLRLILVSEAVGVSLLGCLISFVAIWILGRTDILSFVIADINILNHIPLAALLLVMSVLLGVVSGLYPSWYMTSFPPALVLKGSFGLSASGRKLRTSLIGFQYAVSIGLIICALFVQLQNKYMQEYDQGFDKEQIAIVNIGPKLYVESRDVYRQKLREYSGIDDVAFSFQPLGFYDTYSADMIGYKDKKFNPYILDISWNLLDVLNIPVIGGRNFTEADANADPAAYFIFNKRIQERFEMTEGDLLDNNYFIKGYGRSGGHIAGFVDNIKITSLRQGEDDIAFVLNSGRPLPISYVRIAKGADIPATVEHIRKSIAQIDPSYPFNIDFYDNNFAVLYKNEALLNKMVTAFSFLAIILSIVGVFGLVVFETQYRRKEIGVRKVFGASVQSILVKFNTVYFRIIAICFLLASPFAYYFTNKWLTGFFYRIPIYWWVFAMAFIIVTVITLITVSFQNWQAANENPVDSIKTE